VSAAARGPESYARALEQALSRIRERPVVLSPRDWSLVVEWHAREIPLGVVLEALEDAAARARKGRSGTGPRSLAYVAGAVDEAWELIRSGRSARTASTAVAVPTLATVREAWDQAAREAAGGREALSALLRELLARLDRGEAPLDLDRDLDRRISACLPAAEVAAVERQVDAELVSFRQRVPAAALHRVRATSIARRLRRSLGIPLLWMSSHGARDGDPGR
jgi:hypothetical protein